MTLAKTLAAAATVVTLAAGAVSAEEAQPTAPNNEPAENTLCSQLNALTSHIEGREDWTEKQRTSGLEQVADSLKALGCNDFNM